MGLEETMGWFLTRLGEGYGFWRSAFLMGWDLCQGSFAKLIYYPMTLYHANSRIFIPDGKAFAEGLGRTSHLGIGAHQDDLEFMAFQGIAECYERDDLWFSGIVCADGAGSSRAGEYAEMSGDAMAKLRAEEQERAAVVGRYGAVIQLGYPSAAVRDRQDLKLVGDLKKLMEVMRPDVVYTHNPADKHETHVAVSLATIEALRALPLAERPERVIGCEVWRGLDWVMDAEKVVMDVSGRDALAMALNGVFASQIAGGKRYDLGVMGRRAANATFHDPASHDRASQAIFGIDLTPLVLDDGLDIAEFVCGFIDRFKSDVLRKLLAGVRPSGVEI